MLINEKLHQPLYPMSSSVLRHKHTPEDHKIQGALEVFYNSPLASLPKISEKMQAKLIRLMGLTYRDALFHLPVGAVNRHIVPVIDPEQHLSEVISFECIVQKHLFSKRKGAPDRVIVTAETVNGTAELHLIYFRSNGDMLRNMLPLGAQRLVSGKLDIFETTLQIVHPIMLLHPIKKGIYLKSNHYMD